MTIEQKIQKIPLPFFKEERSGNKPKNWDGQCCLFCGRALSLKNRYWVHMTTSAHLIDVNVDESQVNNSQGWFPIGATCSKKIPSEFSVKDLF